MINLFLTFSDAAKYALVAKSIAEGNGYTTSFSFWSNNLFSTYGILPAFSYVLSVSFKLFGINDTSIVLTSFIFFILSIVFVFLLTKRYSGTTTALLAASATAFDIRLIEYATNGASESMFIFEIVLIAYLISIKNKWVNLFAFAVMFLMYFTRPQAFLYILGLILFYLLNNFKIKKALLLFVIISFGGIVADYFILSQLNGQFFLYSVLKRGVDASLGYIGSNASNALRGNRISIDILALLKKLLYNLYNFYKAIPEIINPYLFTLFVIGIVRKKSPFNTFVAITMVLSFVVTALTIPFYRYLHPMIPLVYVVAMVTLSEILTKIKFSKLTLTIITIIFCVGQTLGILILDSRFTNTQVNKDKPPIYAVMSSKLEEITNKNDLILTNLDTWGSWYGNRKTVWFPVDPKTIIYSKNQIDSIYLTSYKINDDNYFMSDEWKEIFLNPKTQAILENYKFVAEYKFDKNDNYEKQDGRAVLLIREE